MRCHIWRDVVWINLSGEAPAFGDAMAVVIDHWAEFDKPLFHGGADSRFSLKLDCNWKLAVENFCESYHLPWIHPGLNSYSRLEDHYHIEQPGQFSGQGTLVYRQLTDSDGEVFADFEGLSSKWDEAAEYIAVYPNVLLGVHRDHAFTIILAPDGPAKMQEHIHIYYATPNNDPAMTTRNAEQWQGVFVEDVFVVEGMQRGRNAPGFDGGRFSPVMDGPTHMFHTWVASRVDAWRAASVAAE